MHKLMTDHPGEKMLFLGSEAIAHGAIEAGVAFASTYPGTPSSEISLYLFQVSRESDLYFEYSTNEKVALEVATAAANSGVRSMCIMKHVGMNVAADTLMTLAYVGVKAGLVIITADDPFMFSSQNEQDNRYYGKLSGLPVLEPSSVDEAKTMTVEAMELSEQLGEAVILRATTRINHSTSVVELGEMGVRKTKGDFTLIILDNRTTAMTGHQPNPGVDMNELGFDEYNRISIEELVRALGVQHIFVIKPMNIKKSITQIKDALVFIGVSVVIAREKCLLYAKSLKQIREKLSALPKI